MSTRPVGGGPGNMLAAPEIEREDDAPRPTRKLRKLLPFFRPYRARALTAVGLMILVALTGLAGPALAQIAIDDGIEQKNKAVLIGAVATFLVLGLAGWWAGFWQTYLSAWVGERVLLDLRNRLFGHLMGLELGYHERRQTGRTVARLTSDVEAIDNLVTEGFPTLVVNVLTLVGMTGILLYYDWRLALLAFALYPALIAGTLVFRALSTVAYRRTRERVADVMTVLQESLSGMRVVQGFGRQTKAAADFAKANEEYRRANMQTVHVASVYFPGVELLAAIGTAAILWFGAGRVLDDDGLTIGVMVAFLAYLQSFFDPIQSLSQLYNTFQAAMAALEKILGVLETGPTLVDTSDDVLPPIRGDIALENVTFGYLPDRPVIQDVSLQIAAGQTVALVGATGAGKSTLAKLIARFYDPDSGVVRLDGHDLRSVTQASLRAQLGIVPQEGYLFSGTVADNLRFARPSATDAELIEACRTVGALEFVEALPEGIETQIEERGARLSAGQRQLLCFARALVADPRLLILDEATSSIDLRSERTIEEAMRTVMAGRTAIVIAHRLSTIRDADRIVVMEDGRIAEQGSHTELMQAGGRYAALYSDWDQAAA